MYVVMLVHNTIGRGTFDRAHSLGRHLVANGHKVTLFAGSSARATARRQLLNGVDVVEAFDPLPARGRESGLSPFDLISRIRKLRPMHCDLIHCFDHRPAVSLPGLLASGANTPCVFDWADLWGREGIAGQRRLIPRLTLGELDHFLENRVRQRAAALTVINTALLDKARQRFHGPIHLLPVGASSDLIKPLPKDDVRRRFGLPADASIAVHTGLAPYDMRYLAEAFVQVARQNSKALLVMAGRRFPVIEQIVDAAGLSNRVVWLGLLERPALVEAMGCADVLLLPYTNRTVNLYRYPNKMGDYLSAGRPIVTNRTGDLGRLVEQERVGLIADDTPESYAGAIEKLFSDTELATELGRRGRELAENKLDWRFLATGLERFYHDILSRRSK